MKKYILVGDSTVANLYGWGGAFICYHIGMGAVGINLGASGRSTKTYISDGYWDLALSEMKTEGYQPIYVLIQLGHNDMPGGKWETTMDEYVANLEMMVTQTKENNARPVLISPLSMRIFKNGQLNNKLLPWSEAMGSVAKRLKVPFIDLNRLSAEALQTMGPVEANTLATMPVTDSCHQAALQGNILPTAQPEKVVRRHSETAKGNFVAAFDYTHIGEKGARLFAQIVVDELTAQIPAIATSFVA